MSRNPVTRFLRALAAGPGSLQGGEWHMLGSEGLEGCMMCGEAGRTLPHWAVTHGDDCGRLSCLTLETRKMLFGTFNVKVLTQLQGLAATGRCLGSSLPLSR